MGTTAARGWWEPLPRVVPGAGIRNAFSTPDVWTIQGHEGKAIDETERSLPELRAEGLEIALAVVGLTDSQTLTNKMLTSPVIKVGSYATGDLYYRSSGGAFSRLAAGTDGHVRTLASGLPSWAAASGAEVE